MQKSMVYEQLVAVAAGAVCVLLAELVWREVSTQQPVWPFPALYFAELIAIGASVAAAFLRATRQRALVAWVAGGLTIAFSILGAWTVGLLFMPSALGFLAAGLISDLRHDGRAGKHAALALLAAILQAAMMIALAAWF